MTEEILEEEISREGAGEMSISAQGMIQVTIDDFDIQTYRSKDGTYFNMVITSHAPVPVSIFDLVWSFEKTGERILEQRSDRINVIAPGQTSYLHYFFSKGMSIGNFPIHHYEYKYDLIIGYLKKKVVPVTKMKIESFPTKDGISVRIQNQEDFSIKQVRCCVIFFNQENEILYSTEIYENHLKPNEQRQKEVVYAMEKYKGNYDHYEVYYRV